MIMSSMAVFAQRTTPPFWPGRLVSPSVQDLLVWRGTLGVLDSMLNPTPDRVFGGYVAEMCRRIAVSFMAAHGQPWRKYHLRYQAHTFHQRVLPGILWWAVKDMTVKVHEITHIRYVTLTVFLYQRGKVVGESRFAFEVADGVAEMRGKEGAQAYLSSLPQRFVHIPFDGEGIVANGERASSWRASCHQHPGSELCVADLVLGLLSVIASGLIPKTHSLCYTWNGEGPLVAPLRWSARPACMGGQEINGRHRTTMTLSGSFFQGNKLFGTAQGTQVLEGRAPEG